MYKSSKHGNLPAKVAEKQMWNKPFVDIIDYIDIKNSLNILNSERKNFKP